MLRLLEADLLANGFRQAFENLFMPEKNGFDLGKRTSIIVAEFLNFPVQFQVLALRFCDVFIGRCDLHQKRRLDLKKVCEGIFEPSVSRDSMAGWTHDNLTIAKEFAFCNSSQGATFARCGPL